MNKLKYYFLLFVIISIYIFACDCDEAVTCPQNIIILISDGCGYNHVDAASLYQYGKTGTQVYEKFPVVCGMSTYPAGGSYDPNKAWSDFDYVKKGITDSDASATAMACGVKTYNGAIGVDVDKDPVKNIIERCEDLSKSTGVVTSVQLSHATPAGFVAHNKSRHNYEQIAKEVILESSLEVIMGCGHPYFDSDGNLTKNPDTFKYVGGKKTFDALSDGTVGADADGDGLKDPWVLIQTRDEFRKSAKGKTPKRLCGIAQVHDSLQQKRSGDDKADAFTAPFIATVPTLEEMTKAALNVLDNDPDGFFLMVEGGAVDWASHANQSGRVIEEQIDFNKSIEAVVEWVEKNSSWNQTLVIVTADHETGYMALPAEKFSKNNQPNIKWQSGSHTNSLVPFYAKGCGAELFEKYQNKKDLVRGPYIDNTDIAKVFFELLSDSIDNN